MAAYLACLDGAALKCSVPVFWGTLVLPTSSVGRMVGSPSLTITKKLAGGRKHPL